MREVFIEQTVFEWSLESGTGLQHLEIGSGCSRQSKCMQSLPRHCPGHILFQLDATEAEKKRWGGRKTGIDFSDHMRKLLNSDEGVGGLVRYW